MLEIIEYNKDEYSFPCLLVLGCFDAIHEGHRELFKKAKLQAKINGLDLGVMMFYGGKGGKQVFTFEERIKFLEKYNVKFILKIDFNDEFKKIKPLDFLATIEDKLNVKAYMSGKDFRFGAGAKGKSATLKKYAEDEDNGVWYMPVKDVLLDGEKISTTLIKECLAEGNVTKANKLLGNNFYVCGTVINGAGRGASLGFPTVNITYPENKYQIKYGVYKVESQIDGVLLQGVANYGPRPTFNEENPVLEVYFNGYNGDLYGKDIEVSFVEFIRDVQKFESAEQLSLQLAADVAMLGAENEIAVAEVVETEGSAPIDNVVEPEVQPGADAFVEAVEPEVVEPIVEAVEEAIETEAIAEEVTEEVIEEVTNEVTEEVAEEVVQEEAIQEIAEEVVEEATEEVIEETINEVEEVEITEEAVEEAVEEIEAPVEIPEEATEEVVYTNDECETCSAYDYCTCKDKPECECEDNCEECICENCEQVNCSDCACDDCVEEVCDDCVCKDCEATECEGCAAVEDSTQEITEKTVEVADNKEESQDVPTEEVAEEVAEEATAEVVEGPVEEVVEDATEEIIEQGEAIEEVVEEAVIAPEEEVAITEEPELDDTVCEEETEG